LAPAIGALVVLGVTDVITGDVRIALTVAGAGFGLAGAVEDLRGVPPVSRLLSQVAMAVATLPWLLSGMRGPALWSLIFGIGVVFWLVAYVNAFNFMDGVDGMSVVQAVVAGTTWWVVGEWRDVHSLSAGGLVVAAAAMAFAPFNFPRARMFLGDVGSYFFGGWLAVLAVVALRSGLTVEAALAPLAVYLADTGLTLARRVARHEAWYLPHRDHVYQRFTSLGWTHARITALVGATIVACSVLGAVSLAGPLWARAATDVALAGVLIAYLVSPSLLRPS
jgi:UDP-N-acetylmuramyl pentapeptide phosphotransferase/UDP-N-acetylglucosamine-1-phosphate transferase